MENTRDDRDADNHTPQAPPILSNSGQVPPYSTDIVERTQTHEETNPYKRCSMSEYNITNGQPETASLQNIRQIEEQKLFFFEHKMLLPTWTKNHELQVILKSNLNSKDKSTKIKNFICQHNFDVPPSLDDEKSWERIICEEAEQQNFFHWREDANPSLEDINEFLIFLRIKLLCTKNNNNLNWDIITDNRINEFLFFPQYYNDYYNEVFIQQLCENVLRKACEIVPNCTNPNSNPVHMEYWSDESDDTNPVHMEYWSDESDDTNPVHMEDWSDESDDTSDSDKRSESRSEGTLTIAERRIKEIINLLCLQEGVRGHLIKQSIIEDMTGWQRTNNSYSSIQRSETPNSQSTVENNRFYLQAENEDAPAASSTLLHKNDPKRVLSTISAATKAPSQAVPEQCINIRSFFIKGAQQVVSTKQSNDGQSCKRSRLHNDSCSSQAMASTTTSDPNFINNCNKFGFQCHPENKMV